MTSHPKPRTSLLCVVGCGLIAAVGATAVAALSASQWVGRPFPGFFLLPNRVVASIGRTNWPVARDGALYQAAVASVDGAKVEDSAEVYRQVRSAPPGRPFTYRVRQRAVSEAVEVKSRDFSWTDYALTFGSYLWTGLLWLLLGLVGAALVAEKTVARGLLLLGGAGGIYAISATGIYDPGASLRIHALAEAFFPAALVYLALALPSPHRPLAPSVGAVAACLSLALAVPYQLLLAEPGAYSTLHAACETYLGIAGLALTASWSFAYFRGAWSRPLEVAAAAGAVLGLGVPGMVMALSGLTGGSLPVNICTSTAFLFPLLLGYGVARERLGRASPEPLALPA